MDAEIPVMPDLTGPQSGPPWLEDVQSIFFGAWAILMPDPGEEGPEQQAMKWKFLGDTVEGIRGKVCAGSADETHLDRIADAMGKAELLPRPWLDGGPWVEHLVTIHDASKLWLSIYIPYNSSESSNHMSGPEGDQTSPHGGPPQPSLWLPPDEDIMSM